MNNYWKDNEGGSTYRCRKCGSDLGEHVYVELQTHHICYLVRMVGDAPLCITLGHVFTLRVAWNQHLCLSFSLKAHQILTLQWHGCVVGMLHVVHQYSKKPWQWFGDAVTCLVNFIWIQGVWMSTFSSAPIHNAYSKSYLEWPPVRSRKLVFLVRWSFHTGSVSVLFSGGRIFSTMGKWVIPEGILWDRFHCTVSRWMGTTTLWGQRPCLNQLFTKQHIPQVDSCKCWWIPASALEILAQTFLGRWQ